MFQAQYISNAAFNLLFFAGKYASSFSHQSMISRLSSGARTSCWVHVPIFCQTSFAKEQCSIRCPVVSCSWLQREHIGLQGHCRAINLSAVSNLHCTSSHAKNLCLPSASAFQIELPLKYSLRFGSTRSRSNRALTKLGRGSVQMTGWSKSLCRPDLASSWAHILYPRGTWATLTRNKCRDNRTRASLKIIPPGAWSNVFDVRAFTRLVESVSSATLLARLRSPPRRETEHRRGVDGELSPPVKLRPELGAQQTHHLSL